MLGALVPALTAQIASTRVPDPVLRRLYYGLSVAFHKRRSLLLLNLQSQVILSELPWAAPMLTRCDKDTSQSWAAREALELVVSQALCNFPMTILPNKLLQSLRDLAKMAGLKISFVDEIAADIFEGRFSPKYAEAVRTAARVLAGTPYEAYYNLKSEFTEAKSVDYDEEKLIAACLERSRVNEYQSYSREVAQKGCILEQEQILTSHSLAGIYEALGLAEKLDGRQLARKTWAWILKELMNLPKNLQPRLQAAKNIAYAWRQLIFYISMDSRSCDSDIIAELSWELGQRVNDSAYYLKVYEVFLRPLENAIGRGLSCGQPAKAPVLGWVMEKHPLLE